jgi:hypothetical protein
VYREAERQAVFYAENKQKRLMELIHAGSVAAFPDALRFVQAVGALGLPPCTANLSERRTKNDRIGIYSAPTESWRDGGNGCGMQFAHLKTKSAVRNRS